MHGKLKTLERFQLWRYTLECGTEGSVHCRKQRSEKTPTTTSPRFLGDTRITGCRSDALQKPPFFKKNSETKLQLFCSGIAGFSNISAGTCLKLDFFFFPSLGLYRLVVPTGWG